jgi:hypothetical protein
MVTPPWTDAGGPWQRGFMVAAGQALRGAAVACPKCGAPHLRHYFHVLDERAQSGSVWVWCASCGTHSHLARVSAAASRQGDPFSGLDDEAFAALEMDPDVHFLDRLNALWEGGQLTPASGERQP